MSGAVLVLNAGSSTLKYRVVDPEASEPVLSGVVEAIGEPGADAADHPAALAAMSEHLHEEGVDAPGLVAVGHRVVHGGPDLRGPVLVDDAVVGRIEESVRLAPLHNPPALAGIRTAREQFRDLPQVAVFDTDFFADLPAAAATYALDREVARREDIRRYGAHGISHEYVAGEVAALLGRAPGGLAQITLHLGNGASAAAIRGGRPVDTSMGMTPLEGLVMGTRAGDLDPGVLVHLLRHGGLDVDGLDDLLQHRSGLLGMAGVADFRAVRDGVERGDADAVLAYEVTCHRLRSYVGAYLAVLGGADAITFTAGVGEHTPALRRDALTGLERLGIELDEAANDAAVGGPARISTDASAVAVLVVPTDEELAIARSVCGLLDRDA